VCHQQCLQPAQHHFINIVIKVVVTPRGEYDLAAPAPAAVAAAA
jgi:hypothetical protein